MALIPENRMEQILNGDNVTPDNRTEYFVKKAIDNAGSGGGSSLPPAGADGNVLTSTGDAWESAAPSGGEFVCTFTMGETITCDKAVSEIIAAHDAEKYVVGHLENASFDLFHVDADLEQVSFRIITREGNTLSFVSITGNVVDNTDTWGMSTSDMTTLPSVIGSDEGKVLGVDNGSATWVSPSALSNAPLYVSISQTGNTLSTDKTATEITTALDAGKAVVLRQKMILGAGTAEEVTVWSEKTIVGVYHIAATGYELMYVEYDGDTDSWVEVTMTAATGADVFSYTASN